MTTETDHEAAFREALGRVIAMRRAELGLKRNDLRDRSRLSYPYVAELENGTKRPSQSALTAIAEALELRPSELLERAEAMVAGDDLLVPSRPSSPTTARWFHRSAPAGPAAPAGMPDPGSLPMRVRPREIHEETNVAGRRGPGLADLDLPDLHALIRSKVRAELQDVARNIVREELQGVARDTVRDELQGAVRDVVRDELRDTAREVVRDELRRAGVKSGPVRRREAASRAPIPPNLKTDPSARPSPKRPTS